jgi:predicted RNA binding protein YcfA (HicA-like mRNA interferase family)
MNGNELLKKLKKLGKQGNIAVRFETKRGKGSHGTLYYGSRKTILKDRKKEIGPGLLSKMLAELGLDKDDMN